MIILPGLSLIIHLIVLFLDKIEAAFRHIFKSIFKIKPLSGNGLLFMAVFVFFLSVFAGLKFLDKISPPLSSDDSFLLSGAFSGFLTHKEPGTDQGKGVLGAVNEEDGEAQEPIETPALNESEAAFGEGSESAQRQDFSNITAINTGITGNKFLDYFLLPFLMVLAIFVILRDHLLTLTEKLEQAKKRMQELRTKRILKEKIFKLKTKEGKA